MLLDLSEYLVRVQRSTFQHLKMVTKLNGDGLFTTFQRAT